MVRPIAGGTSIIVSFMLLLGVVACSDDETVPQNQLDPTSDAGIAAICDIICDCECSSTRDDCIAGFSDVRDAARGTSCESVVEEYYGCVLDNGICTNSGDFSDDACDYIEKGDCLNEPQ
jgi:hypothetical protein